MKNPRAGTIQRRGASSTLCRSRHKVCLRSRLKKKKEWITPDTWQAKPSQAKSRRALKKKVMDTRSEGLNERYRQQYREAVKRTTRADKQTYMKDLASQAEQDANGGEQGQVYKITERQVMRSHRHVDCG